MPELTQSLLDYIRADLVEPGTDVDDDTELLISGLVDSLGVIQIVVFIEEALDTEIDPADVVLENFQSVAAMVAFAGQLCAA